MERLAAAVVESSVILKWFRPDEPFAQAAEEIRKAYMEERLELVVPDLALYEIANVMRFRASEEIAHRAVESLFDLRIPIHRVDQPLLRQAVKDSFRCGITVYDAVFLAVKESLHLQLVTADRRFRRSIHRLPGVFLLSELRV